MDLKSRGHILGSWWVFVWSFPLIGAKGTQLCDINHFQLSKHSDLDLWTQKSIGLDSWTLSLYEIRCSKGKQLENWHSQRGPRWGHVTMTLTFDLLTLKSISVFLSLSSICVWSLKSLGWKVFELSRYNEVWTDRRTARVITIGLPHLRWRGPNYAT